MGINQEEISVLFDDFVQYEKDPDKAVEGTGLGLSITKSLVDAMNGTIKVQSEVKNGSKFIVTIPQLFDNPTKIAKVDDPGGKYILIYERRLINAQSIMQTMENLNVNHTLVTTASEFCEELETGKYQYVFVASVLYNRIKKTYKEYKSKAEFVLIAEYGEAIPDRNVSIITTPIFCMPVANFINGVSDNFISNLSRDVAERLIAPKARVLIVDDINTNLKVAEGLLQPYQIYVDLCKSGADAIEAVKSIRYDLILMDHMMPEMNGIATTKKIRSLSNVDPYYATLPIIALTANAVSGTREMFLNSGFNDFLSKPINTLQLRNILELWIPKEKQELHLNDLKRNASSLSSDTSGFLKINGIDTEKGVRMSRGSYKDFIKMLKIFYKDAINTLDKIKKAYEEKNVTEYITYVHGLKSASAIVGADELSEKSKMLELAGRHEDWLYIDKFNEGYMQDIKYLIEDINLALADGAKPGKKSYDATELEKILVDLKEALTNFDFSVITQRANDLQELTLGTDLDKITEKIIHNKMIGEYDDAIVIIDDLMKKKAE